MLMHPQMLSSYALIGSSVVANFLNFAYNAYLGRTVSYEEFGLISLISSFLFLTSIPLGALSKTVVYQTAFILGKYNATAHRFWLSVRRRALVTSLFVTVLWLFATPLLAQFFHTSSVEPFILFAPIWIASCLAAVDKGFLSGSHKFWIIATVVVCEASFKLFFAWLLVTIGLGHFAYAAVPLSIITAGIISWLFAFSLHRSSNKQLDVVPPTNLSKNFFTTSVMTKISGVTFLSVDVILAKHFLLPSLAGQYAYISLVGNMIYYIGDLFGQFLTPVISKELGASKNSKKSFYILLGAAAFASICAYVLVGPLGFFTVPLLFGAKAQPIIVFLPIYGIAMFSYSIANQITQYYQIHKKNIYPLISVFFSFLQILGISLYHKNIGQIVTVMVIVTTAYLLTSILMHIFNTHVETFSRNCQDFFDLLFAKNQFIHSFKSKARQGNTTRILIFNWRDTKHKWAGGAEVYVHEIAKRLVKRGYKVSVFCGNDGDCARNQVIDGVQMIRRGGFYTVYVWAFLYYVLRFRGLFDVVIDSENGIPFFTPLFVGRPVIRIVYHVHQEVFRNNLIFPLARLAMFLESTVAPLVYHQAKVITISESSKKELEKMGFKKLTKQIEIVKPGVDLAKFHKMKKTTKPSILYLGRLKPYKSVDTILHAMSSLIEQIPNIEFVIAGDGESRLELEQLSEKLKLRKYVKFLGRVSDQQRSELMAKAWVVVQPSQIEGWGITNIEANASGTPVVAADVPGLRDSVMNPHTGFLVEWGSTKQFAQKINSILKDAVLRKKLETGALDWSTQFSWETSVSQVEVILREART